MHVAWTVELSASVFTGVFQCSRPAFRINKFVVVLIVCYLTYRQCLNSGHMMAPLGLGIELSHMILFLNAALLVKMVLYSEQGNQGTVGSMSDADVELLLSPLTGMTLWQMPHASRIL